MSQKFRALEVVERIKTKLKELDERAKIYEDSAKGVCEPRFWTGFCYIDDERKLLYYLLRGSK